MSRNESTGRSALSFVLAIALLAAAACDGAGGDPAGGVSEEVIQFNVLGTAYLGQQNWAEAEKAFRKALELDGDEPLLATNVAVALIQQGEIERAVEMLNQALEIDAACAYAHYNLGLLDNQNGEFEQAAAHFEAVAQFDPDDLFTQYFLGTTLARCNREEDAIRAYRRALEMDPTHVSTLYGLGRLLLQRGDQDEGRELIARSQEIRSRSGLDVAVGGQYGEQGPFALGVDYAGDALAAPEAIDVSFEVMARGEGPLDPAWTVVPVGADHVATLVLGREGSIEALTDPATPDPLTPAAPGRAAIRMLRAGDVDNDGEVELVALLQGDTLVPALLETDGVGFEWVGESRFSGAAETRETIDSVDLTLVDADHDGDLDLFWCWTVSAGESTACRLATNDGAASFETIDAAQRGIVVGSGAGHAVSVAFSDVDNDRDIDLLVAAPAGIRLFSNQRDGSYEDVTERAGLADSAATVSLTVADLNKDDWMDLVAGDEDGIGYWVNRRGRFEAARRPADEATDEIVVIDYDNDGFLDLVGGGAAGTQVVRNLGRGDWEAQAQLADAVNGRPLTAFDADADGDQDLAVRRDDGVYLLRNEGGSVHNWIRLDSRGAGDNKLGIGAKVKVLAGGLQQKFEVTRPLPLHAGLGRRDAVQTARYLWPSGVLQDEVELKTNSTVEIAQLDRKGTSCPLLYAWRDGRWRFVTDFLGGCAIGYLHAPGIYSTPDTDEYVRIEGGLHEDAHGRLSLRLNNQLEEVIWFDQAELVAIDHPAGTEVYPNERLMPSPPWPTFELYASNDVRPIASAHGLDDGSDLTDRLADLDRRYVDNFRLLPQKGYAESHSIELDLGPLLPERRTVLLLDGWIDYADSSANLAAHQAGIRLMPPRLTIADGRGGWVEPEHLMGFPAGLPKTMAVDLSGHLRSNDHRVRITTNMRIYWDRARVMVGGESTPLHVSRLRPLTADLGFGGFPAETSPEGAKPFVYDPSSVSDVTPWKAHAGAYTPFGDVRELLGEIDDRFVTTKAGDEIVLQFPALGPTAAGWTRTYLLYADGFGKDMDPNSAANGEVRPIPFHGMPTYPFAESVVPPRKEGSFVTPPRRVLPSPEGWPGAVPQPLVSRPIVE